MLLSDARTFVRRSIQAGIDTARFTDADIDCGILHAGNYFVNETKCTRSYSTAIAITLSTAAVDFSSLASSGFRGERAIDIRVAESADYTPANVVDGIQKTTLSDIALQRANVGTSNGTPNRIAFTTYTAAVVWPPPKATGTLNIVWSPPFIDFTPGTATPTTLNIPTDLIWPMLLYGAPAVVQNTNAKDAYVTSSWLKFLDEIKQCMGMGNLGDNYVRHVRGG